MSQGKMRYRFEENPSITQLLLFRNLLLAFVTKFMTRESVPLICSLPSILPYPWPGSLPGVWWQPSNMEHSHIQGLPPSPQYVYTCTYVYTCVYSCMYTHACIYVCIHSVLPSSTAHRNVSIPNFVNIQRGFLYFSYWFSQSGSTLKFQSNLG